MKPQGLLVGAAAGLASALLFAGLVTQSVSALGLSLAAPIPIVIASLGWGSTAGFIAAFVSAAIISLFTGTAGAGAMLAAAMGLPAAIAGHLCGLARPRAEMPTPSNAAAQPGDLDWYPVERILFAIALLSAVGCIFVGWLIGFDAQTILPILREALSVQAGSEIEASQAQIEEIARTVIAVVPFVQPALLVSTLVASVYLGAAVTRLSGRLQRPRDDIPARADLPRAALPIFAIALAGSFLDGAVGNIAAVFTGAIGMAFTLVGLASLHLRSRGRSGRGLLLFAVYSAMAILTFPVLVFLVLGVVKAARPSVPPGTAN